MGRRGNSAIAGDDRRGEGNGGKPAWIQSTGRRRRGLNDKHFKRYWRSSRLERGDNLLIKLNSYSANISDTGIISWLAKLLLRHINEDPIHHRRGGERTLYKLAWMKSSDLQERSRERGRSARDGGTRHCGHRVGTAGRSGPE